MSSSAVSPAASTSAPSGFDVDRVRRDFPILQERVHGKPLVYLDNAATSQKPSKVIDAVAHYYRHDNANIHRGVHALSQRATVAYEEVRAKARTFLNAREDREIVFVRGTTEALNLVAHSLGRQRVGKGDEVLVSAMEHHSNIVPWQLLCDERGATIRVLPMSESGDLLLERFEDLVTDRTRLVAVSHVSNALGTVNPIAKLCRLARARGIPVVVDGAQAAPHLSIDVQKLDCDFYAISSHKMFGPTGVGVLYGRAELLEEMPPYEGGGDMISSVSFSGTTYAAIPSKFEAGTPNIAGTIGFGAAIDYLGALDSNEIQRYEAGLVDYAIHRLGTIPNLRFIGTARERVGVVSFVLEDVHAHDLGTIVDLEGVAIRTGHHCAQPIMQFYGVPATARASFAFYNTRGEVDKLVAALGVARKVFAR